MINLNLTDENIQWLNQIRKFIKENILPRKDLDQHGYFPLDLYEKAFKLGIVTSVIPQKYGGSEKSLLETTMAAEECAYGDLGFTTSAFLSRLSLTPLLNFGTEEQKRTWLPQFCEKLQFSSFCFTEPEGSSNLGSRPASTTVKEVEGGYIINGTKATISNASYAALYTVFARFDSEDSGMSCFLIPRTAEGVSVGSPYKKMGQRAADTAEVTFRNVFVPKDHLLGKIGQGAQIALKSLRFSRVGVGAMAVGVCKRARDLAKEHCHQRIGTNNKMLIHEQDIKFRFAEIEAKIEMLSAFVFRAVWELEHGNHATKFSSSVKLMGGKISSEITNECLDLLGGKGYLEEGYLEKLVRDAKLLQIYEGTEAVQKLLIADSAIRLNHRN
jgi:acyl-CoA dehydrogenase